MLTWFSVSCLHSISCSTHPSSSFIELLSSELILDDQLQNPLEQLCFLKDSQFEGEEAAPHNLSDPDFSLGGRSDRGGVAAGGRAGGEVVCCSCHQPAPAASLPLLMRASRSKNVQPAHVHTRWLLSPCCACSQTPGRQLWRLIQFLLLTKSVHNKSESKTINFES